MQSKALYTALQDDGAIKHATAKRYVENSVGAVRLSERLSEIFRHSTGDAVVKDLKALDIDSENKLAKAVSGGSDKSKAQRLAEQVVGKFSTKKDDEGNKVQGDVFKDGLTDEELDEFHDVMRELMAARTAYRNTKAAKAAEAEAVSDNKDVNGTMDAAERSLMTRRQENKPSGIISAWFTIMDFFLVSPSQRSGLGSQFCLGQRNYETDNAASFKVQRLCMGR